MSYKVAIVGATGAVGLEILKILEQRQFPIQELRLLASHRSASKKLLFNGEQLTVQELTPASLQGCEIILSSAGAAVSREFVPHAQKCGAVVIDNTSAFRMEPNVPLVVPEVNPQRVTDHQGIIANPNCSTIQMVVALKPIHDAAKIRRIVASTYQAVSGKGLRAMTELEQQTRAVLNNEKVVCKEFPYQIAFNLIPHIDNFQENNYTKEEMKMVLETQKIFEDYSLRVTATTVRVPVFRCHSEAINIETERKITVAEVREILTHAPGVKVVDDPKNNQYPMPVDVTGKDEVFVGRIREDISIEKGIDMWVVADQLRKGAALNAIQIAEILISHKGTIHHV